MSQAQFNKVQLAQSYQLTLTQRSCQKPLQRSQTVKELSSPLGVVAASKALIFLPLRH